MTSDVRRLILLFATYFSNNSSTFTTFTSPAFTFTGNTLISLSSFNTDSGFGVL
jgi:hypothetical protein